jgi:hypothetical protein
MHIEAFERCGYTGERMYYEAVTVKKGETISGLGVDYGFKGGDWRKIWEDPKNAALRNNRGVPERLQIGDAVQIPIPWRVIHRHLIAEARGAGFTVTRNGGKGLRLSWVQTVYRANQPIGPNPSPFCVDACTPDDNLPFYWTDAEIKANPDLRKTFQDHPSRPNPTAAIGTTRWRAIVSIAVVTEKRVTVYDSSVWGFDLTPAGTVTKVGPRAPTAVEVSGHLNLLRKGVGTGAGTFKAQGWTFRTPPPP